MGLTFYLQLSDGNSKIGFVKPVGDIPANWTKLPPFLHQGMKEAHAEQKLLENIRFPVTRGIKLVVCRWYDILQSKCLLNPGFTYYNPIARTGICSYKYLSGIPDSVPTF